VNTFAFDDDGLRESTVAKVWERMSAEKKAMSDPAAAGRFFLVGSGCDT
jgi:hypothetical protein